MIENRVRKLKLEESRLQKQIRIANRHSELADMNRQRKEDDDRNKQMAFENEQRRIEN